MPTNAAVTTTAPSAFAQTMQGFPGPNWLRDGCRFVEYRNAELIGRTDDEIVGRTLGEVHGMEREFEFARRDAEVLAGKSVEFQTTINGARWTIALWPVYVGGRVLIGGCALRIL